MGSRALRASKSAGSSGYDLREVHRIRGDLSAGIAASQMAAMTATTTATTPRPSEMVAARCWPTFGGRAGASSFVIRPASSCADYRLTGRTDVSEQTDKTSLRVSHVGD